MGIGETIQGIAEKCKAGISKAAEAVKSHLRIAAAAGAALLIIIILLLILAVVKSPKKAKNPDLTASTDLAAEYKELTLSPEDFFLPDEPDFVPDVILEREPRDGWAEEDARPFWSDPMENNGDTWRKRIQSGVDDLLEHIP
jgi:hypothetical protein